MSDLVLEPQRDAPRSQAAGRSTNRNINDIYWRKADGWICVGPALETAQSQFWLKRGREPLEQYSYTDRVSSKTGKRETIENSADNLARERFYWFFKNGGAKEFPVEQIVAYNWHVKPPYGMSKEIFPQLEEYVLPDPLWCPLCPPSAPTKNSPAQLVQHGMIGHGLQLREAKALLENAAEAPTGGGLNPIIRKKSDMTKEAVAKRRAYAKRATANIGDDFDPLKSSVPICNNCGEQIEGKLKYHQCETRQPAGV